MRFSQIFYACIDFFDQHCYLEYIKLSAILKLYKEEEDYNMKSINTNIVKTADAAVSNTAVCGYNAS